MANTKDKKGAGKRQRPTPKNPEHLTAKQKKFVNGKLEGKSSRKAALDAGYSEQTAAHANRDIAQKPAVDAVINDYLLHAGVSTELLARRIFQGLSAMETKTATCEGKITDRLEVIDWGARLNYIELALKLRKLMPAVMFDAGPTLAEILEEANRGEKWGRK